MTLLMHSLKVFVVGTLKRSICTSMLEDTFNNSYLRACFHVDSGPVKPVQHWNEDSKKTRLPLHCWWVGFPSLTPRQSWLRTNPDTMIVWNQEGHLTFNYLSQHLVWALNYCSTFRASNDWKVSIFLLQWMY